MPLILITALLGFFFIINGRSRTRKNGLKRPGRLSSLKAGRRPVKEERAFLVRFFRSIYRALPERLQIYFTGGFDKYVPFLDYPIEVLAGIRAFAVFCFPLSALLLTGFSPAGIALSIPLLLLGAIFPAYIAARERNQFFDKFKRSLPHTADLLYSLVLGGKNIDQAFRGAALSSQDPVKDILMTAVREMELGSSKEESFERLVERYPIPQMASLLRSITEAERRGLVLSETLEVFSRELRLRNRDELRVMVSKTPLKILAPLVFLILPSAIILAIGPALLLTFSQFLK